MVQFVEVIRCPIMMQSRLALFPIGSPENIIKTEQFRLSVGQKVGQYCGAILLSSDPPQFNKNCTLVLFSTYTVASCWYAPFKVVLVPDSHSTWPTIFAVHPHHHKCFCDIAIKLWEHIIETNGLFKQSPSPLSRATMQISSVAQWCRSSFYTLYYSQATALLLISSSKYKQQTCVWSLITCSVGGSLWLHWGQTFCCFVIDGKLQLKHAPAAKTET